MLFSSLSPLVSPNRVSFPTIVTSGVTKPGPVPTILTIGITESGIIATLIAAALGRRLHPPQDSSPAWAKGGR